MKVSFDALNRFERPKMYLCNPGCVCNDGILSDVVGGIFGSSDEELVINFNSVSELNFRIRNVTLENAEENAAVRKIFRGIQNRRLIFLDDIGFFMISDVKDGYDAQGSYKDVTAQSCESEIENKTVPFIGDETGTTENGTKTYKFSNQPQDTLDGGASSTGNTGLLEIIVESLPLWTVAHVDDSVASRYRTFEGVSDDRNCLSFMMEDMQDAYECIFVFDTINRYIYVYDQSSYIEETNIHITKDDVINSIDITETSDDLYTALTVFGEDNLSIAAVNPLGTNTIYNFDHYLDWMSTSLRAKVVAWSALVASKEQEYYELSRLYYNKWSEWFACEQNIKTLNTQITMYRRCRENIVAESGYDKDADGASTYVLSPEIRTQISGYNDLITENNGEPITIRDFVYATLEDISHLIDNAESRRDVASARADSIEASMQETESEMQEIRDAVSFTNTSNFSESELSELTHYIYEGNYTDEYITVTDIMTYDEKFEQMHTLYSRGKTKLKRVSEPSQEFSIDVENFLFAKEFAPWSEELETGKLINVELEVDDVVMLFLATITVNYDDESLKLTFGNRFSKFDPKSVFNNVLGDIQKSANTLSYIKEILYPVRAGEFNSMKEALRTSRDLTKATALSSTGQEVVIDDTGYTGRRVLESGEYDDHQIKITGKNIVFTDDAWDSCKTAIGEIVTPDGDTAYGINAEAVVGDIIVGNQLRILNDNGEDAFTVANDKIEAVIYGDEDGLQPDGSDSIMTQLSHMSTVSQTAEAINLAISSIAEQDHVTTSTGYTFDQNGLKVKKAGSVVSNEVNNLGMYVKKYADTDQEEKILVADTDGVNAINLTSRKYLYVGHSRFETYNTDRTACYYITEDASATL